MEGNNLTNTYDIGFKASTAASLYVTIYRFSPAPGDWAMATGVDLDKAMVMARGHGVMGQEGMVHGGTDHGVRNQRNQRSKQGCRKSKIGWELTKSGCHVRSLELFKKKTYMSSF